MRALREQGCAPKRIARILGLPLSRDGMPYFVEGPNDDPRKIMATPDKSVGPGNYHFLHTLPPSAIGA